MIRPQRHAFVARLFVACALWLTSAGSAHATLCGTADYPFPFTDVGGVSAAFCEGILHSYVLGVTRGTSPTTFSPNDSVSRLQMTTFLQRSFDQGLRRSSPRAALGQWWAPKTGALRKTIPLPGSGSLGVCKSDGESVWIAGGTNAIGVLAKTGQVQLNETWGTNFVALLVYNGLVTFVAPNSWFHFTPTHEPPLYRGTGIIFSGTYSVHQLTFDGESLWTANYSEGVVKKIPWIGEAGNYGEPNFAAADTYTPFNLPIDVLFDGSSIWVAEEGSNRIRRLDPNDGSTMQTIAVGVRPGYMVYDGANIWVPNTGDNSITVVKASSGEVVATIASSASNRLNAPVQAAFDGERILVTNPGNHSVTMFRAADLGLIGNVQLAAGSAPFGACSDGTHFWVTLRGPRALLRL